MPRRYNDIHKHISISEIIKAICFHYRIDEYELFSTSRKKHLVFPRMMFYYMARRYTLLSFNEIAQVPTKYGRENPMCHSTVLLGSTRISNFLDVRDKEIEKDFYLIDDLLQDPISAKLVVKDVDLLKMCG